MTANVILSDIAGLTRVAPFSRRGFMAASSAAAAGYTLAAGPVRADAITTEHRGAIRRNRVGESRRRRHAGLFRAARRASPIRRSSWSPWRFSACTNTSRTSRAGSPSSAPSPSRPTTYFRKGDLTKITDMPQLFPIVNAKTDTELFADLDATVAWAKSQGGNTERLGIMGFCRGGRTVWRYSTHNPNLKAGVAFYGSLTDPQSEAMPVNASTSRDAGQGAGARALWRGGSGHHGRQREADGSGAQSRRQDRRVQDLSRRARTASIADYRRATARRRPRTAGTG